MRTGAQAAACENTQADKKNGTGAMIPAKPRVLIVKRDKLGDVLLTSPLIERLRAAGCEVDVLASEYNAWVARGVPGVSKVYAYPRLRAASLLRPGEFVRYARTFHAVRAAKYDAAIAAGGEYSKRAIDKALAARAGRTIAYAPRTIAGLTDPVPPGPYEAHEAELMLELAAPLRLPPFEGEISLRYEPPAEAHAFAGRWLKERSLEKGQFIVLGLGARRSERQPSTAQVLRWTERWRAERGLQTVFMWTPGKGSELYPGDDEVAEPVLAARRADIHPYRGPIVEALGLIWAAASSVFPDSGLMHFASASPGGVVGLFAGKHLGPDPERWAPRGPRARWLRAEGKVADMPDERLFRLLYELLP
jgi:ADP-heptose:LPS heptosyltransferase